MCVVPRCFSLSEHAKGRTPASILHAGSYGGRRSELKTKAPVAAAAAAAAAPAAVCLLEMIFEALRWARMPVFEFD